MALLNLSSKQRDFCSVAEHFVRKELAPIAESLDKKAEFPRDLILRAGALGLMGVAVPSCFGGAALDTVAYVSAIESISSVCASTGVILSVNNSLVCDPVLDFGSDFQKKQTLCSLAKGEKIGCFALTEPNAGSDCSKLKTIAKKEGDEWVINGNKIFITNGMGADIAIVFAMTNPEAGSRGMTAFLVDTDADGFKANPMHGKMGIRASGLAELVLDNVRVSDEQVLGEPGEGFKIAMKTLDGGRIGIAAQSLGIARGAFLEAQHQILQDIYSMEEQSMLVQEKLAHMKTQLYAAGLLTYEAAFLKDQGKPYSRKAAQCKLMASRVAVMCTNLALDLCDSCQLSEGSVLERLHRDARITEIYEGTSEIQQVVISSAILGR